MNDTSPQRTLSQDVAAVVREKIIGGELTPGQKLSEAALSDSLQISRNTLREVFRVLTMEGLLAHEPNKGVSVVVPSIDAIIDIYRVRRMVECQALAHAYPLHPAHAHMRQALEAALHERGQQNWAGVGTANMAFHKAVVELADSEQLNSMFSQLLAKLRLAFGLLRDPHFLHAPFVDRNVHILKMFEDSRPAEAAQALHDYLVHSERVVLTAYTQQPLVS